MQSLSRQSSPFSESFRNFHPAHILEEEGAGRLPYVSTLPNLRIKRRRPENWCHRPRCGFDLKVAMHAFRSPFNPPQALPALCVTRCRLAWRMRDKSCQVIGPHGRRMRNYELRVVTVEHEAERPIDLRDIYAYERLCRSRICTKTDADDF